MITVIGSYLSPYVRKVLVCMDLKGIGYEIDPLVPFFGDDRFTAISPVRRIPVLLDGDLAVPDSTVICEYLEDRYPDPPLYPSAPEDRARARWLEAYAGTRMGEVFIWRFFNELTIRRFVWGERPDQDVVRRTREVEIPAVLDYLEPQLPADGFLFGDVSVADIAIAVFFRNVTLARTEIDVAPWPKTQAFVRRLLELPAFAKLVPFEDLCASTPIPDQRAALRDAGAPVSTETYFQDTPRRGILSI